MAYPSLDLLNTTLADLGEKLVLTHAQSLPLMDKLMKAKQVNKESRGGTYIERTFAGGSPAKGKRIINGDEVANLTRILQTRKFQVSSVRHFIPIYIPNIELSRNNGEQGVISLLKSYPEMTTKEYFLDSEFWLLTAGYRSSAVSVIDSPDFDGACTLNGAYAGSANGLLDFATPATQADVVQGIAKDSNIGFANQYAAVTGFASDGMTKIGQAYDTAAAYTTKGPDLGFADPVSFQRMVEFSSDSVRIPDTDRAVFGAESRSYLPYKQSRVYHSINLDPTNASFTGSAALSTSDITGGCVYFLTSEDWEVPYYEMRLRPDFREMIADQDGVVGHLVIDQQPICLRFNTQAVVAGTRIP